MKKELGVVAHAFNPIPQEWNMQKMWDIVKRPNLYIIGIKEGEESLRIRVLTRSSTGYKRFSQIKEHKKHIEAHRTLNRED